MRGVRNFVGVQPLRARGTIEASPVGRRSYSLGRSRPPSSHSVSISATQSCRSRGGTSQGDVKSRSVIAVTLARRAFVVSCK